VSTKALRPTHQLIFVDASVEETVNDHVEIYTHCVDPGDLGSQNSINSTQAVDKSVNQYVIHWSRQHQTVTLRFAYFLPRRSLRNQLSLLYGVLECFELVCVLLYYISYYDRRSCPYMEGRAVTSSSACVVNTSPFIHHAEHWMAYRNLEHSLIYHWLYTRSIWPAETNMGKIV